MAPRKGMSILLIILPEAPSPEMYLTCLSPAQLERKRANDREAQRAIRQRTRVHIEKLEADVESLKASTSFKQLQALSQRNEELEREVAALKEALILASGPQTASYSPGTGDCTCLDYRPPPYAIQNPEQWLPATPAVSNFSSGVPSPTSSVLDPSNSRETSSALSSSAGYLMEPNSYSDAGHRVMDPQLEGGRPMVMGWNDIITPPVAAGQTHQDLMLTTGGRILCDLPREGMKPGRASTLSTKTNAHFNDICQDLEEGATSCLTTTVPSPSRIGPAVVQPCRCIYPPHDDETSSLSMGPPPPAVSSSAT
ncbi:hypothetical protein B0I35DRAFT_414444 [Stachybotrys elegans]|uniref:BZIP domain-containing protein n=1 Tax=Stachybotrys elegans TaxID=80388 RepID=A0A8K0WJS5_9HYPO|nr:hypothetical protein B0I35DRAFT_414444 [Stachybotrys elegans]